MAIASKLFSAFLVICLARQAFAECTLSDIKISQSSTGFQIHGKPEYEVTISNNCICSQSSLLLSCPGFQTTESVDPNIFKKSIGSLCIINNGLPVFQGSPIKFKYAWDNKYVLPTVSSQINCS